MSHDHLHSIPFKLAPWNEVFSGCSIDETVIIPQPDLVNLFECEIGPRTKIAAFVEIGRAVIGSDCKIEFGAFLSAGVTLEDWVFVGPGVCFANDKHPSARNQAFVPEKTLVKRGASIGMGARIGPGLTLGENCMIGMGAVVTRDVPDNMVVIGVPAEIMRHRYDYAWRYENEKPERTG